MGKVKRLFVCSLCERPLAQWAGRCPSCGEWGSVSEQAVTASSRTGSAPPVSVPVTNLVLDEEEHRIRTGYTGVDRVLGGGLVPGSVVLLAGAPGTGKSTLLLQLASRLAAAGHPCLLASGEESRGQISARARRLGVDGDRISFLPGRDLGTVVAAAQTERPSVLVVDSIQTIRNPESDSLPGGTGQVRACADALTGVAKDHGIAVILVGHVTKDGDVAGPRTLEHAVDVVMTFEGDHRSGLRVLVGGKNRFGAEGEVAWFDMGPAGLVETETGPRLGEGDAEPGSSTALALAGRRAFAVDVQALVVPTDGPPRRQVAGLDPKRFHIVAAVTDLVLGVRFARSELFGAAVGGLRLEDPGVDLAMAAALASAATGRRAPPGTAFVGEVSLTGSIRPVGGLDRRISAASAAGLSSVVCAQNGGSPQLTGGGIDVRRVGHLRQALAWARGPGRPAD